MAEAAGFADADALGGAADDCFWGDVSLAGFVLHPATQMAKANRGLNAFEAPTLIGSSLGARCARPQALHVNALHA